MDCGWLSGEGELLVQRFCDVREQSGSSAQKKIRMEDPRENTGS